MAAELVSSTDVKDWRSWLSQHSAVLKQKTKNENKPRLVALDQWYREELSAAIQSRSPAHLTPEELAKLMQWKLLRGKFRPTLQALVESNPEAEIRACSVEAFKVGGKAKKAADLEPGLKALCRLRGVGPATASAILAAVFPNLCAFMSDEAMLAVGISPLRYDVATWRRFSEAVAEVRRRTSLSMSDVELALWTATVGGKGEGKKKAQKRKLG